MLKGAALILLVLACRPLAALGDEPPENLFAAARQGDLPALKAAIEKGADVNARTRYGATALSFAASRGRLAIVRHLLDADAEINTTDTFYKATPIGWAAGNGHIEIVKLLLEHGAKDVNAALRSGARRGSIEMTQAALDTGKVSVEEAFEAREVAEQSRHADVARLLAPLADKAPKPFDVDTATLKSYAGAYQSDDGLEYEVRVADGKLEVGAVGRPRTRLRAKDNVTFARDGATYTFHIADGLASSFTRERDAEQTTFKRVTKTAPAATPHVNDVVEPANSSGNWPSFRGSGARGVADGQQAPLKWDVEKSVNVRWRTPIDGLAHSCPIVWGDKVFLTTAVSKSRPANLRTGLFGDVNPVEDEGEQSWQVLCLDKATGRILWLRIAHEGAAAVKRHPKSTHANSTPCTDGKHVVAFFASEGLYCYDTDGELLWRKSLGVLDSGWFYDADYQWGFASSPIIFRDLVIVQCDIQQDSFIAAFRLTDGTEVWRTSRKEIPTWSTPTTHVFSSGPMLITNGTRYARGYNPLDGEELWRFSGHSEIAVPTPVVAHNLIYIASGYRPIQPIYALRPDASGDVSLKAGQRDNSAIAWSRRRGGPYMPTPIVYGAYLYTCDNAGVLACYDAKTGERLYQRRLPGGGAYSASPVAADGHLYFTSEEGVVRVVKAGPKFAEVAANRVGEPCLATPAISAGQFFIRTEKSLIAVGGAADQAEESP